MISKLVNIKSLIICCNLQNWKKKKKKDWLASFTNGLGLKLLNPFKSIFKSINWLLRISSFLLTKPEPQHLGIAVPLQSGRRRCWNPYHPSVAAAGIYNVSPCLIAYPVEVLDSREAILIIVGPSWRGWFTDLLCLQGLFSINISTYF